jgi:hypothetical protein
VDATYRKSIYLKRDPSKTYDLILRTTRIKRYLLP